VGPGHGESGRQGVANPASSPQLRKQKNTATRSVNVAETPKREGHVASRARCTVEGTERGQRKRGLFCFVVVFFFWPDGKMRKLSG